MMATINVATDLTRMKSVVRSGVSFASSILLLILSEKKRKSVKTLIERFSPTFDIILCVN